jgi:hypothetical protein
MEGSKVSKPDAGDPISGLLLGSSEEKNLDYALFISQDNKGMIVSIQITKKKKRQSTVIHNTTQLGMPNFLTHIRLYSILSLDGRACGIAAIQEYVLRSMPN